MWGPVVGWEKSYEVSDHGQVRNATTKKVLAFDRSDYGLYVELRNGPVRKSCSVARLVLLAFEGEPPTPNCQAMRLDGVRENVKLSNLVWNTPAGVLAHTKWLRLVPATQVSEEESTCDTPFSPKQAQSP